MLMMQNHESQSNLMTKATWSRVIRQKRCCYHSASCLISRTSATHRIFSSGVT